MAAEAAASTTRIASVAVCMRRGITTPAKDRVLECLLCDPKTTLFLFCVQSYPVQYAVDIVHSPVIQTEFILMRRCCTTGGQRGLLFVTPDRAMLGCRRASTGGNLGITDSFLRSIFRSAAFFEMPKVLSSRRRHGRVSDGAAGGAVSGHSRHGNVRGTATSAAAGAAGVRGVGASGSASGGAMGRTSAVSRNLVAPNKSMGQNFLKNPMIVQGIVERAAVQRTDVVLEIGPGTGNLTVQLLERAKKVIAVELDTRMVREVMKRVEGTEKERSLQIIQGDVLKTPLPFFDVLVANVPYNISSPLLFKLLAHRPMFRCAVIMFQEEFAQRLTARPGTEMWCRLSVNTQLLAKVDQLFKVNRNNFRPPPKVDSRVVRIELRNPPPPVNFTEWDGMIRIIFNRKHKTLRSTLTTKCTLKLLANNYNTYRAINHARGENKASKTAAAAATDAMDDDGEQVRVTEAHMKALVEEVLGTESLEGKRAASLDIDDLLALLSAFNEKGVHFA